MLKQLLSCLIVLLSLTLSRPVLASRLFSSVTDRISQGAVAMPVTGTMMFWLYPNWSGTDSVAHLFFDQQNSSTVFFRIEKYSDNQFNAGWRNTTAYRVSTATFTINAGAWNHVLITWDDTANETKLYLNGSQIGSTVTSLITTTLTGTRYIGNLTPGVNANADARIAEYAIWNAVLSAPNIASLNSFVRPSAINPGALVDYLPLLGTDSPEPNLVGGGASGTIVSGTSQADHPPMVSPSVGSTMGLLGVGR